MVPKARLELARPRATTPSRWRVYQFHHFGIFFRFLLPVCWGRRHLLRLTGRRLVFLFVRWGYLFRFSSGWCFRARELGWRRSLLVSLTRLGVGHGHFNRSWCDLDFFLHRSGNLQGFHHGAFGNIGRIIGQANRREHKYDRARRGNFVEQGQWTFGAEDRFA